MLIRSLPKVGVRYNERRLAGIPGGPPSLLDPPAGCRFRDRCPLAFARCAEEPPVTEVASGHHVACWKAVRMLPAGESPSVGVGAFGGRTSPPCGDVSFDVAPGEVVSLIGESGSGKSTIGKMVLRLTRVSEREDHARRRRHPRLAGRGAGYYRQVQGVFQDPFSCYNPIFKADRVL